MSLGGCGHRAGERRYPHEAISHSGAPMPSASLARTITAPMPDAKSWRRFTEFLGEVTRVGQP